MAQDTTAGTATGTTTGGPDYRSHYRRGVYDPAALAALDAACARARRMMHLLMVAHATASAALARFQVATAEEWTDEARAAAYATLRRRDARYFRIREAYNRAESDYRAAHTAVFGGGFK